VGGSDRCPLVLTQALRRRRRPAAVPAPRSRRSPGEIVAGSPEQKTALWAGGAHGPGQCRPRGAQHACGPNGPVHEVRGAWQVRPVRLFGQSGSSTGLTGLISIYRPMLKKFPPMLKLNANSSKRIEWEFHPKRGENDQAWAPTTH
jgi:hypothetical protein